MTKRELYDLAMRIQANPEYRKIVDLNPQYDTPGFLMKVVEMVLEAEDARGGKGLPETDRRVRMNRSFHNPIHDDRRKPS